MLEIYGYFDLHCGQDICILTAAHDFTTAHRQWFAGSNDVVVSLHIMCVCELVHVFHQ